MTFLKTCTLVILAITVTFAVAMQAHADVTPSASDIDCDTVQSCIRTFADIPIPNTAWLLALGLVCLVGLKRKG